MGIGGNFAGKELADSTFDKFWAKFEALDALVFLDPQGTAGLENSGRLDGVGLLTTTIGNSLEKTIALSHLIFEGTLDRFPGLKICADHGGGYLPSYANRSDAICCTFPNRVGTLPKKSQRLICAMANCSSTHRVHAGSVASSDRGDRTTTNHGGNGLPFPVDLYRTRPSPRHTGTQ